MAISATGYGTVNTTTRVWTASAPDKVDAFSVSKEGFGGAGIQGSWENVYGKAGSKDQGTGAGDNATTYYLVEYSSDGGSTYIQHGDYLMANQNAHFTDITIRNLTPSLTYTMRVTASNQYGVSAPTVSSNSITLPSAESAPGAPGAITVTATNAIDVTLGWSAPTTFGKLKTGADADSDSITYQLEYKTGSDSYAVVAEGGSTGVRIASAIGSGISVKVEGLTTGTAYDFRIKAKNTDSDYGIGTEVSITTK